MTLRRRGAPPVFLSALKPRNLHITHGWGGGLDRWVGDFCRADHRSENLVLEPVTAAGVIGMGYRLIHGATREEISGWTLQRPVTTTTADHAEYRALLQEILVGHEIDHVYVSSLLGHSLDVFSTGRPVTRVWHDFYPWCPAIHCYFESPCTTCAPSRMRDCVSGNELMMPFGRSPEGWGELRRRFAADAAIPAVRHVAATPATVRRIRRLDPRFESIPFAIIPHGIGPDTTRAVTGECPATTPAQDAFGGATDGRRLRAVIVGRLHVSKGVRVLERIFELARCVADLHFIGSGPTPPGFEYRWGTEIVRHFAPEDLPGIFARHRPDMALFLSVVPETFSYALSEVMAHGIPPVARRLGSFEDRIRHGENGFLTGPADEDIVNLLLELDENRDRLRTVSANLLATPVRTAHAMVDDYYRLRGDWEALYDDRLAAAESRLAAGASAP